MSNAKNSKRSDTSLSDMSTSTGMNIEYSDTEELEILDVKMIIKKQFSFYVTLDECPLKLDKIFFQGFDPNVTATEFAKRARHHSLTKFLRYWDVSGWSVLLENTKVQNIINSPGSSEELKDKLTQWKRKF